MKTVSLNPQSLRVLANATIAVAAAFIIWQLSKGLRQMNMAAEVITQPIGSALSDVTAAANGWEPVQATQGGFVLNSKYVAADGTINSTWRTGIEQMYPGNDALMAAITYNGKLLPQYSYLLDGKVTLETIKAGA
jgi:hypothetical protein